MRFDNSLMEDFAGCSAQGIVRHGLQRAARGGLLYGPLGNIVHLGLKRWFDGGTVAECDELISSEYDKVIPPGEVPVEPMFSKSNISRISHQYFVTHPVEAFPFEVEETEVTREIEIAPGFFFHVKRDMLVRDKATGMRHPLDHKSRWGKVNEWWLRKFRNCSQFSGYIYANQVLTGEPSTKLFVNLLSMAELPGSDKKCREHKKPYSECGYLHTDFRLLTYDRTQEQLEVWKRDLLILVRQYETMLKAYSTPELVKFAPREGSFRGTCMFCDYFEWCRNGFDESMMESETEFSPWEPWKEGEQEEPSNYPYLWFFNQSTGKIHPTDRVVHGERNLPRLMALKKLWEAGRDVWMAVWKEFPFAQVEMAEFARGRQEG